MFFINELDFIRRTLCTGSKDDKETKEEASQRKKEEKKAKIESQYKLTDSLLKGKKFVLEAQFLKYSNGDRVNVVSTLNFISIDSLSAVIQVGLMQRVGYNGV